MARFACQRIQLLDTQRAEAQWTEQSFLQRCCSSTRPVASLMCRAVYDTPSYRSRHSVLFGLPCSEIMAPYVVARASKCSTRRALRTLVYIRPYKNCALQRHHTGTQACPPTTQVEPIRRYRLTAPAGSRQTGGGPSPTNRPSPPHPHAHSPPDDISSPPYAA